MERHTGMSNGQGLQPDNAGGADRNAGSSSLQPYRAIFGDFRTADRDRYR